MKVTVVDLTGIGLEFVEDYSREGEFAEFVKERGNAIHYFCLLTHNIEEDIEILKQQEVEMLNDKPRIVLRGKRIAFTKPSVLEGLLSNCPDPSPLNLPTKNGVNPSDIIAFLDLKAFVLPGLDNPPV